MKTINELQQELNRIRSRKAAARTISERAKLAREEIRTNERINLARKLAPAGTPAQPKGMTSREALQYFRGELAEIRSRLQGTTNPETRATLLNQEQSALEKVQLFRSFVPEEMGCRQLIEYRGAQA